jgi:hypothetical protein
MSVVNGVSAVKRKALYLTRMDPDLGCQNGAIRAVWMWNTCTDKKENQIFLICKEIQNGAVAK